MSLQPTSSQAIQDEYRVAKEEKWQAQERDLMACLDSKATSFFQMCFEGAMRLFTSHGYPPPGIEANFLDVEAAMMEYLPEAFKL